MRSIAWNWSDFWAYFESETELHQKELLAQIRLDTVSTETKKQILKFAPESVRLRYTTSGGEGVSRAELEKKIRDLLR